MNRRQLAAIVEDSRLSGDARTLVLHVALKGDGFHEVPFREMSRLLNQASDRDIRRAVLDAVGVGYLNRREGGRGHGPSFQFSLSKNDTLNADSLANNDNLSPDSLAKNDSLKTDSLSKIATLSDSLSKNDRLNGLTRGKVFLSSKSLPDDGEDDGEDAGADVRFTRLAAKAEAVIVANAEKLHGCRDSLRDYLTDRVKPARQSAYVHSVVGWLNGIDPNVWSLSDGSKLPESQWTAALANALNDLAASDEAQMKRPSGDVANLRTKVSILLNPPKTSRNGNGTPQQEPNRRASRQGRYPGPPKFDYAAAAAAQEAEIQAWKDAHPE